MQTKPMPEMDEHELRAVVAESSITIDRFKATLSTYSTAVRQKQRALAILRDRFGFDATTGRRVRRRTHLL
jgi:hypothetical protein